MKLIDIDTGEILWPNDGRKITCKNGAVKGQKFSVRELIAPCEQYPQGLVKGDYSGITWREFFPSVFNAKIV